MLAATIATALAAPLVAFAALLVFRALTAPPSGGRHRVATVEQPYRPRPAAPRPAPVVPGNPDPDATSVTLVRDMGIPVPVIRRQAPLSEDVTHLMNALAADIEALDEPTREVTRVQ